MGRAWAAALAVAFAVAFIIACLFVMVLLGGCASAAGPSPTPASAPATKSTTEAQVTAQSSAPPAAPDTVDLLVEYCTFDPRETPTVRRHSSLENASCVEFGKAIEGGMQGYAAIRRGCVALERGELKESDPKLAGLVKLCASGRHWTEFEPFLCWLADPCSR